MTKNYLTRHAAARLRPKTLAETQRYLLDHWRPLHEVPLHAAELGISRARISQYVKMRMPVRSDGKLDREAALNWIGRHQSGLPVENKGANRARQLSKASSARRQRPSTDTRRMANSCPPAFRDNVAKCETDLDEVAVMTVMQMVYRAPAIAATMAVMAGASPHLAYHLNSLVSVALMGEAQDILAEFGIQPFADGEELLWLPGGFAENNWAFLAEHSGAALDVAGWQEAMLERNRAIQAGEVGFDAA